MSSAIIDCQKAWVYRCSLHCVMSEFAVKLVVMPHQRASLGAQVLLSIQRKSPPWTLYFCLEIRRQAHAWSAILRQNASQNSTQTQLET